jgi:hypothetical protein
MKTTNEDKKKREELESLWNVTTVTYEEQKPGKLDIVDFDPSRVNRPSNNPEVR